VSGLQGSAPPTQVAQLLGIQHPHSPPWGKVERRRDGQDTPPRVIQHEKYFTLTLGFNVKQLTLSANLCDDDKSASFSQFWELSSAFSH